MRWMGRKDGGERRKQKMIIPKVLKYKIREPYRSSITIIIILGTEYEPV